MNTALAISGWGCLAMFAIAACLVGYALWKDTPDDSVGRSLMLGVYSFFGAIALAIAWVALLIIFKLP